MMSIVVVRGADLAAPSMLVTGAVVPPRGESVTITGVVAVVVEEVVEEDMMITVVAGHAVVKEAREEITVMQEGVVVVKGNTAVETPVATNRVQGIAERRNIMYSSLRTVA